MKASDVIAIVSIVSTAVTAIIVSVLTFRNSRQLQVSRLQDEKTQRQQETTRAMHREFNAPDMTLSRTLAWATVHVHHTENFDWMRRKLHPQEIQNVWNVMYFYQRLSLALKFGNIYQDYVPKMFGENFLWWYEKRYKDQLVGLELASGP